jgi:hypothetical protein
MNVQHSWAAVHGVNAAALHTMQSDLYSTGCVGGSHCNHSKYHVLPNPQLKTRTVSKKVLDVRMQQATASHNKQGKSVMKIH